MSIDYDLHAHYGYSGCCQDTGGVTFLGGGGHPPVPPWKQPALYSYLPLIFRLTAFPNNCATLWVFPVGIHLVLWGTYPFCFKYCVCRHLHHSVKMLLHQHQHTSTMPKLLPVSDKSYIPHETIKLHRVHSNNMGAVSYRLQSLFTPTPSTHTRTTKQPVTLSAYSH